MIWCEICRKYKPSPDGHGVAVQSAQSMITGCTTVGLHTVKRHAGTKEHIKSTEREMARLPSERAPGTPSTDPVQPKVDATLQTKTSDAHHKLIETAYQLAKTLRIKFIDLNFF